MKDVSRVLQDPWSMQISVTYGCNYACWFCGIHKSFNPRDWHHYRFIDPNLLAKVFDETRRWLPRIRVELNTHGEPTLHPQFDEVVRAIRTDPKAQIQVQTNSSQLEDWDAYATLAEKWFSAGLNLLVTNAYDRWWGKPNPAYPSRYHMLMDYARRYVALHPEVELVDYYYNNPQRLSVYHYQDPRKRRIFVMDDLGVVNTKLDAMGRPSSKDVKNNCGNNTAQSMQRLGKPEYPLEPLKARCTRVFREIILEADGHICACCYDWRSQLVFGKFPEQSLREIWTGEMWNAVRELLYRKNRNMTPCNRCDYNGGPRQGFLRSLELTETDEELHAIVAAHMKRYAQYTHPSAEIRVRDAVIKKEVPGAYHY
jgi:radical SAM protein with 4Fe4S-binding SPASM domain